jgi:serine/threonine protein kinase
VDDYAAGQGVLNRDIKPSNLLLDAKGNVWVTDFGLAKASDSEELTHTGGSVQTFSQVVSRLFRTLGRGRPSGSPRAVLWP